MGIRYDSNTKRATNGPMIFFSDPITDICLQEEIRGAVDSGLSFYAYRRPGDTIISFGSSERIVEGIGMPGFVIAPFDPKGTPITIPWKPVTHSSSNTSFSYKFPSHSTSFDSYSKELDAIKDTLNQTGKGKIVAARVICNECRIDTGATFTKLCGLYPSAFVFAFSTPSTGCWIGATPELLLSSSYGQLHTMALAGTRKAGITGDWDTKNIEEQKMVEDFIVDTLIKNGFDPNVGDTYTRQAGNIAHICTPVSADISCSFNIANLKELLSTLSPTPAVCGFPREKALDVIHSYEDHNRGCYGGFCGPYSSLSDFSFHVNLRCALIEQERYAVYVGSGITLRSNKEEEWEETSLKSQTVMKALTSYEQPNTL